MVFFSCSRHLLGYFVSTHTHTHTHTYIYIYSSQNLHRQMEDWSHLTRLITCTESVTMNSDGYLILVAAIKIKIGGPVVRFRTWQLRQRSKSDVHLHYKKAYENKRMKCLSSTSGAEILQNYFIRLQEELHLLT